MHSPNPLMRNLHYAINDRNVKAALIEIENCLKQDVSLDDNAWACYTPLHWASLFALSEVTKRLLECGATPDIDSYPHPPNYDGKEKREHTTPLSIAVRKAGDELEGVAGGWNQEYIKITKLLIEYGADVNGFLNFFPLILINSCLTVTETLLRLGADIQQIFNDGLQVNSSTRISSAWQNVKKARLLLRHGAALPKYNFNSDGYLTETQFAAMRSIADSAEYANRIFHGHQNPGWNLSSLESLDIDLILRLIFLRFAQAGFKINEFLNQYNSCIYTLPEIIKNGIIEMVPVINYAHAIITLNPLAEKDKIELTLFQQTLLIEVITMHLQRSKNSPITNSSFEEFYQFICDNPILELFIDKALANIFPSWGEDFKSISKNLEAQLQFFLAHYLNLTQPKSFPLSLPYDALNRHSTMLRGTAEEIKQKQKDIIKTKTSYDDWLGFAGSFYGIFISCLKKPYKHEILSVSALQKEDIFSQIIFLRRLDRRLFPEDMYRLKERKIALLKELASLPEVPLEKEFSSTQVAEKEVGQVSTVFATAINTSATPSEVQLDRG